jgi:hypothetical protein
MNKSDPWVCIEDDEEDYVIDQFEIRTKGKKPLVLRKPGFGRLTQNTKQYLNCPLAIAKEVIRASVLDTLDPPTIEQYEQVQRTIEWLEKHEAKNIKTQRPNEARNTGNTH